MYCFADEGYLFNLGAQMTTTYTTETIAEMLSRITPEPWLNNAGVTIDGPGGATIVILDDFISDADADFIAASPAIVRQLLAERDTLLNENKRLQQQVDLLTEKRVEDRMQWDAEVSSIDNLRAELVTVLTSLSEMRQMIQYAHDAGLAGGISNNCLTTIKADEVLLKHGIDAVPYNQERLSERIDRTRVLELVRKEAEEWENDEQRKHFGARHTAEALRELEQDLEKL